MLDNTIKVRITNEELYRLGFEKVIYNGKEYVDKSPLFWIQHVRYPKLIMS